MADTKLFIVNQGANNAWVYNTSDLSEYAFIEAGVDFTIPSGSTLYEILSDTNYVYLFCLSGTTAYLSKYDLSFANEIWSVSWNDTSYYVPWGKYTDEDFIYLANTQSSVQHLIRVNKSDGSIYSDTNTGSQGGFNVTIDATSVYVISNSSGHFYLTKYNRYDMSPLVGPVDVSSYGYAMACAQYDSLYSSGTFSRYLYEFNKSDLSYVTSHYIDANYGPYNMIGGGDGYMYSLVVLSGSPYIFKVSASDFSFTQHLINSQSAYNMSIGYITGSLPSIIHGCSDVPYPIETGVAAPARTYGWIPFHMVEIYMKTRTIYLANSDRSITWNGNAYTKFPFTVSAIKRTASTFEESGTLSVSGVQNDISSIMLSEIVEGKKIIVRKCYWGQDFGHTDPYIVFEGQIESSSIENGDDAATITIELKNEYWNWEHEIPHNSFSVNCNFMFKSTTPGCQYIGTEQQCDRSYVRCSVLQNTDRFRGFPDMVIFEDKELWWGKVKEDTEQ